MSLKYIPFFLIFFFLHSGVFSDEISVSGFFTEDSGKTGRLYIRYSLPENTHLTLQKDYFYFSVEPDPFFTWKAVQYPEGDLENGKVIYRDSVTIFREFTLSLPDKPEKLQIPVSVFYQLCDDSGTCFPPGSKKITLTYAPSRKNDSNSESLQNVSREDFIKPAEKNDNPLMDEKINIFYFLMLSFLGGLLLNIMPCVLPVLSIKAINLVAHSGKNKRKILFSSLFYALGIIISLQIMAGVIIFLKLSGEFIGWGFQLQNPVFLLVLISLIYLFGLSLLDFFSINPPVSFLKSSNSGYFSSFITGIFAVVLSTPCTAPFLGTALAFSFSQEPQIILMCFFFIGIGLSFPFIMLGFFPSLFELIPKPGNWMNIFRQIMGFLLIATSIWLFNVLLIEIGSKNIIGVIIFLFCLTFSVWLYETFVTKGKNKNMKIMFFLIAVLIVIFSTKILNLETNETLSNNIENRDSELKWEKFSPEKLQEYRDKKQAVFIDFSAEWCATCKGFEIIVLSSKEVRNIFDKYNVKLLKADFTNGDIVVARWIKKFGKVGVPLFVLYLPEYENPVIVTESISKDKIAAAFKKRE